MEWVIGAIVVVVGLALLTQRWVWVLAFGLGSLASGFACLASIFHFQILGALGFFILATILGGICSAISDG